MRLDAEDADPVAVAIGPAGVGEDEVVIAPHTQDIMSICQGIIDNEG